MSLREHVTDAAVGLGALLYSCLNFSIEGLVHAGMAAGGLALLWLRIWNAWLIVRRRRRMRLR